MNTYSKALRHISMRDVKQKHQQKLTEQKFQEELKKKEERYIKSVMETKKYDWRKEIERVDNKVEEEVIINTVDDFVQVYDWKSEIIRDRSKYFETEPLEEGMTTSDMFFTTLSATGEVDLQSISGADAASFDPAYTTGIEFGSSGNGSGRMGGFNIGQNYVKFSQTPDASNDRTVDTIKVDTSEYTTITVNAIAGSNNNGGVSPTANLFVYWFSDTDAGLLGSIPSSATSLTQYSFTLPPEARGKNIDIYFYEPDVPLQRTQYIGQSIPSLHPSTWNDTVAGYANNILMKANPTSSDFDTWGGFAWIAMQQQYYGASSAYTWNTPGYPAPVSGYTNGTTQADRIAVGQAIYNAFGTGSSTRYPLTYGIKSIGYQRRTPVNVFVSLDSPEATAFIRTEPNLSNLSPEERKQKLKEMLESSDEYVAKMFGDKFPGSGVVPPGESGDVPGVEITDYQPQPTPQGSKDPELMKKFQDGKPLNQIEVEKLFPDPTERKDALNFYNAKNSIDMYINMLDKLKSDPKRQGDYNYYTRPSMIKAHIEDPKAKLQKLEQEFTQKYGYSPNNIAGKSPTPPTPPTPPKPQLDKYGRQIGTPLPPGVQQDIEKGGKTASPVGDAAIMAAAAALIKGGFKSGASSAETGSQLPARGSAEWQRMAKEYTRANPGQYNPFMTNAQNQLMQKYGVGRNAMSLRSLKNSYYPQGDVILEKKKLKSPEEVLNKIPGYYDGKPAPLGFPETPPPEMVNGMHPDLVDGKKVSDRFNRLDPESAKATPLTGNTHVDKKILKARKQPK